MDGYEAHMMGSTGVYVEDPIHEYMKMQREQLQLAYEREMERIDKLTPNQLSFEISMEHKYPTYQ